MTKSSAPWNLSPRLTNMIGFFKRKTKPVDAPTPDAMALCGTIDMDTGECKEGYYDKYGELKYKRVASVPVWSEPVYYSILTNSWIQRHHRLFGESYSTSHEEKVVLCKITNKYTERNKYFYVKDGIRRYVDTDALEKGNTIVYVNPEP